jgi:hypothetical protein
MSDDDASRPQSLAFAYRHPVLMQAWRDIWPAAKGDILRNGILVGLFSLAVNVIFGLVTKTAWAKTLWATLVTNGGLLLLWAIAHLVRAPYMLYQREQKNATLARADYESRLSTLEKELAAERAKNPTPRLVGEVERVELAPIAFASYSGEPAGYSGFELVVLLHYVSTGTAQTSVKRFLAYTIIDGKALTLSDTKEGTPQFTSPHGVENLLPQVGQPIEQNKRMRGYVRFRVGQRFSDFDAIKLEKIAIEDYSSNCYEFSAEGVPIHRPSDPDLERRRERLDNLR